MIICSRCGGNHMRSECNDGVNSVGIMSREQIKATSAKASKIADRPRDMTPKEIWNAAIEAAAELVNSHENYDVVGAALTDEIRKLKK